MYVNICRTRLCGLDMLWQVRCLVATLDRHFKREFTPGWNIVTDETLAQFKGRSPFRQYIQVQTEEVGIQVVVLCRFCHWLQIFSVRMNYVHFIRGSRGLMNHSPVS